MANSAEKQRENPGKYPRETEMQEDISSFTCEICMEPVAASKKFNNKKHCAHPFCQDCIGKYIAIKIQEDSNSGGNIECPGLNCSCILDPLSCRPIISPSVFTRWCDFLCETAVLRSKSSYCPSRDCLELVVNECGGNVRKTNCPKCKKLFCFQCKTAWHEGLRCEESRDDIQFAELTARKKWRRCPHCGQCVERSHGCSLVKCRCGTHFCYHCGRRVSGSSHWCGQYRHFLDTDVGRSFFFFCVIFLVWFAMFLVCITNDTCSDNI